MKFNDSPKEKVLTDRRSPDAAMPADGWDKLPPALDTPGLRYFLTYVRYNSQSDESSGNCPSSEGQLLLARRLCEDLAELGIRASLDENGYVMAKIPGNGAAPESGAPAPLVLGLIAHLDSSPDFTAAGVAPRVRLYDGSPLPLDEKGEFMLSEGLFPALKKLRGHYLVTGDGSTLLGADDKAGVAAIMALLRRFRDEPELPHGPLAIAFTPDEEIGRGARHFDVKRFAATVAYTIDGGADGELSEESFNAAEATVRFTGRNVHPGSAKDKMVNACLLARDFAAQLDDAQTPARTDGREGFYHLTAMQGDVEEATLSYIIRDFERDGLERRKANLQALVAEMNTRLGTRRVELKLRDQYANMKEVIDRYPFLLERAKQAMLLAGVAPDLRPTRGGTDGSQLSFMGLPCPNLFTGGDNFHGRYEYLSIDSFNRLQETLLHLCALYAGRAES